MTITRPRNLRSEWYGAFDMWPTEDGGKAYRLPHTLARSAIETTITPSALLLLIMAATAFAAGHPFINADPRAASLLVNTGLAFIPLQVAAALASAAVCFITGYRTGVTIKIDTLGLTLDDAAFFPREHLWRIRYGTTSHEGTDAEVFTPKVEIQIGTQIVVLGDDLEPVAGHLFMRLFQSDIRTYWHQHD